MSAPQLVIGHVVAGRYSVRALLGFSAEAATYHAVASSGHEVVLKLFDPLIGQRADVMSKLTQVNDAVGQLPLEMVVPAADSGYDAATSAPYIVSEFVQQPSLESLVRNGPLAPLVAAAIVENLARVLEACHARQLHHLALKPANVFVGPAPDYAVRLADFGVSVVRSTFPTHKVYPKSAPFWSPEQLQSASTIGAAADVFAAALIAFYLLTGRSFWASCQSSPPDLARWQAEVMAPRPTVSQVAAQLGVNLPDALDAAFARALCVNPNERPRSAMELARAIAVAAGGSDPSDYRAGLPTAPTMALPENEGYSPPRDAARQPQGSGYPGAPGGGFAGVGVTPGLPPIPPAKPEKASVFKPIAIGAGLALLIGAVATYALLRPKPTGPVEVPTHEPVSVPVPTPSELPAEPASSVAAQDEGPSATAAAPTEATASAADKIELTVTCIPVCDEVLVDNELIQKVDDALKISVLPGKHTLEARKVGYITVKETISVDKSLAKEVRLFTPTVLTRPTGKPCVRSILKRCP